MRFRWKGRSSRQAFVCSVVVRVSCRGLVIDRAIQDRLASGIYCDNPELVSEEILQSVRKEVARRLEVIAKENERTRRGGKRTAG